MAVVLGTGALASLPAHAASRPNVLFLLADDLGQRDLGCYGSTFYETPHLDALARDGARFTDAYAACPVCSPTRASLLTRPMAPAHGRHGLPRRPGPDRWNRNTTLLPAPQQDRLALETVTLAETLKTAGYATFFAGKWHLGPEGWWPENQGFDVNRGGTDQGGPYGGKQYFSPYGNPRLSDGPPGEHLPDRLATETVQFITDHRDRPFLAYLAFYSVHTPLMAREDLRQKYEARRRSSAPCHTRLGPRTHPRRSARAGSRGLCRHGRGPGPGRRQGPRPTRHARPSRPHAGPVHQRQRRSFDQRRLAHFEPAPPRRQGLAVRGRHSRAPHRSAGPAWSRPAACSGRPSAARTSSPRSWMQPVFPSLPASPAMD
ncbi:MAG: sulfatase-like hydrolase/transferase [Verrucomicrobia bacterium]|nr:sulfatase-like hydrolase/transferase [Verrucomicrobiota bacterium]